MKKLVILMVSIFFLGSAFLFSCNSPSGKIENAENDVLEAKKDLDKVNQEYLADIENYKRESAEKIAANNKSIEDFKARIEVLKKEAKADYNSRIAELENRNSDIKKKINDYKAEGRESWEKFKVEFNRDLVELGDAFNDFTTKNVK